MQAEYLLCQSVYRSWPQECLVHTPEWLTADPDLLKQLCTKSFMKFHDRPDLQMRLSEGREITDEGMLSAKCATSLCMRFSYYTV